MDYDGLQALGGGVLTEPQSPFCAVPERTKDGPLVAFRWPNYPGGIPTANVGPFAYRTVARTEYRLPGVATYEVSLQELSANYANADGLPAGQSTPVGQAERPSAIARLLIRSGGNGITRLHSGRATLAVTGEYVGVELQYPVGAVLLASQPLPSQGVDQSQNVVVTRANVRIVAVPARSRRPSEWRVADWVAQRAIGGEGASFQSVPVYPGASDVRVIGLMAINPAAGLRFWTNPPPPVGVSQPTTIVSGGFPAEGGWIPIDGVTYMAVETVADGVFCFVQRGFV